MAYTRAFRSEALVVLARYPRAGSVKQRLAAAIGDEAAVDLYRAFLSDLQRRFARHPSWAMYWAFDPAGSPFAEEIGGSVPSFPQAGGSLGERMRSAMAHVLGLGHSSALLIGSDIPHVPLSALEDAFHRLRAGAPLVLGPADDGGYYLVGASTVPAVFTGIRWGGVDVLRATVAAARTVGIEPQMVAGCYDIDDQASLERLRMEIAGQGGDDLISTRSALERLNRLR